MSRRLPSLRAELSRSLWLISAAWLLTVLLSVVLVLRHEAEELMDEALRESAELIFGVLAQRASALAEEGQDELQGQVLPAPPHKEHLVWQLLDTHTGRLLLRSHSAPPVALLAPARRGLANAPGGWRLYALPLPDGRATLLVAQTRAERLESRYGAIAALLAAAFGISAFWALLLSRRLRATLQPLAALGGQIQGYDPMRAETALPPATRAELLPVRSAIHELGERLALRVRHEQAFAAHAAHALRTPLAGMDAQLALAQREVGEGAQPRILRARAAVERLKRVVSSLLLMFRSGLELDLQDLSRAELADLALRLPLDQLELKVEGLSTDAVQAAGHERRVWVRADPNLLSAALANLLDNSLRHGAHQATLSLEALNGEACICLRDDGPGVSAERRAELQASLERPGDDSAVGLGLRLAHLVAQAHGGHLSLDDPAAGEDSGRPGFAVRLSLPLADSSQAEPGSLRR